MATKEYMRVYDAKPGRKQREYTPARKRQQRAANMKRRYGVTLDSIEALFATQGRRCAVCKTDKPNGRGWNVDHDHTAGKVRGVLCSSCNRMMGLAKDSVDVLRSAASYLRKHK